MSQQRIVIIVLVLIVVLYIVATGLGVKNSREENDPARDGSGFEAADHPLLQRMDSWNPFAKSLDPERVQLTLRQDGRFILPRGSVEVGIEGIEVRGKHYARATLERESGAVRVWYSEDGPPNGSDQPRALDEPMKLSVSSSGGTLYFTVTTDTAQLRIQ